MLRLFFGVLGIALIVGCSSKDEKALLDAYSKKTTYHKLLQMTEEAEFLENNTPVAMLTATYKFSPNFKKHDDRDEVFIVGIEFSEPEESSIYFKKDDNATLKNINAYLLTLNHKSATHVVKLTQDDKRLKDLSFVTQWGDYYEVTYPHTRKKFSLIFENVKYGEKKLHFAKVAKFVYTKKGF